MEIIGYALCVIGAAIAIAVAVYSSTASMARQPEIQSRAFTVFILACAFVEALALIGFVSLLII